MKLIKILIGILISLFILAGCDMYTNNISGKTKDVLQSNLNSDAKLAKYKMRVVDILLVSESMSKYEGIAKIDFEGKTYDVPVSVSADLNNILVQTKPGGFIFLFEKEMNEAKEKFEKDMDESARDLEQKFEVLKEKLNQ
jgi:hypothetical protein